MHEKLAIGISTALMIFAAFGGASLLVYVWGIAFYDGDTCDCDEENGGSEADDGR